MSALTERLRTRWLLLIAFLPALGCAVDAVFSWLHPTVQLSTDRLHLALPGGYGSTDSLEAALLAPGFIERFMVTLPHLGAAAAFALLGYVFAILQARLLGLRHRHPHSRWLRRTPLAALLVIMGSFVVSVIYVSGLPHHPMPVPLGTWGGTGLIITMVMLWASSSRHAEDFQKDLRGAV